MATTKRAATASKRSSRVGECSIRFRYSNSDKVIDDTIIHPPASEPTNAMDSVDSTNNRNSNNDLSQSGSAKSKRYSDRRKDDKVRKPFSDASSDVQTDTRNSSTWDPLSKDLSNIQNEELQGDSKKESRDNLDAEKRKNRVSIRGRIGGNEQFHILMDSGFKCIFLILSGKAGNANI